MAMDEADLKANPEGNTLLYGFIREGSEVAGNWLCLIRNEIDGKPMIFRKRIDKVMAPAFIIRGLCGNELADAWQTLQEWDVDMTHDIIDTDIADTRCMVFDLENALAASKLETASVHTSLTQLEQSAKPLKAEIKKLQKQINRQEAVTQSNQTSYNKTIKTILLKHEKEIAKLESKHVGLESKLEKMTAKFEKEQGKLLYLCSYCLYSFMPWQI
jgi:hypothetical protein